MLRCFPNQFPKMPPPPSTTPPSSSSSPPTRGRALFSFTDANDDQEQDHEQVVKGVELNTEQPNDSLAHANQSNLINQATNTLQIHPPTQHLSHSNTNELAVAALSSGGFLSGWFTKHPQNTNELDQADANQSASKDVASAVPSSLKKRPLSFTEHGIEMKRTYSDSTLAASSIHPHSSKTTSIKEPIRGSYHLPQLHKPKHDPRDWSAHHSSTTSHQPADRENHLKRVPSAPKFFTEEAQMFSDTAEILQLQNPEEIHGPEDVAKLMRKKGISTWAAVTAFSSGAAGAPSVNATPAITVGGSEDQDEISGADSIPLKDADEVDSVRRESSRRITNRTSVSFIERKRHIQLSLSKSASESVLESEAPPHHPANTAIDNEVTPLLPSFHFLNPTPHPEHQTKLPHKTSPRFPNLRRPLPQNRTPHDPSRPIHVRPSRLHPLPRPNYDLIRRRRPPPTHALYKSSRRDPYGETRASERTLSDVDGETDFD